MTSKKTTVFFRITIFIVVVVMLFVIGWIWWFNAISPIDPSNRTPVTFAIRKGEGVKSIVTKLSRDGLIRSSTAFYILIKILRIERDIQAGEFRLARSMGAEELAQELTHGMVDVWATVLEGWRVEEIATKLARDLDIPEGEFLKSAKEGYMFPDTYLIPKDASGAAVSEIMINNFEKKVTEVMRQDLQTQDMSLEDAVILASIVEREAKGDDDRPIIAGILRKRLSANWPLQTDATLQYILGYQSGEKTWWTKNVLLETKELDSPYNTYKYKGLPRGPISNPGLASIRAVIYPRETDFWFYLHDDKGKVHYAKTTEEHSANIEAYLR